MKNLKLFQMVVLFLVISGLTACVKDELEPETQELIGTIDDSRRSEFDNEIGKWAGDLPQLTPIDVAQVNGTPYDTLLGGYLQCHVTPMKIAPGFDFVKLFSPDNIHVGGWLNGSGIRNGNWSTVPVTHFKPITVAITLSTPSGVAPHKEINDPSNHSEYLAAHNELVNLVNQNATAADVNYEIEEIYSYDQSLVEIGASAGGWGQNIAASYNFSDQEVQSRLMIKFVQKYYNVEMDIPNLPNEWFKKLPDYNALKSFIPTYVSSITYGRMVYIIIESKSSMTSTKAAIQGAFRGWGGSFNFNYSQSSFNQVEIKNIKSFIVGGSSNFLTHNNFSDIGNIISSGAQFSVNSPGVPVAFTVRRVSDNSIVNFVTMAEYAVQECTVTGVPYTVQINNPIGGYQFCPDKYNGDNEYGGCVEINGNVKLELSTDLREIWAIVDATFHECSGGDTKAKIDPSIVSSKVHLYTAPVGKTIHSINVNDITYFGQIDNDSQNLNHLPFNLNITSGFIDHIKVVGDTDSNDLPCDGSNNNSYFKVFFKDFGITLSN